MDDAVSQSLFVVGTWAFDAPYSASIIELETPHENASSSANNTPVFRTQSEFSAHIPHLSHAGVTISTTVSLPPASSTEDLYMLSDWFFPNESLHEGVEDPKLPGLIFNLGTKKCIAIKPHLAPKYLSYAVTSGDHIYFLQQPKHSCFESYNTLSQEWVELEPHTLYGGEGVIEGSAVLDDTILFYIDGFYGLSIKAYNVVRNRWYHVVFLNDPCYRLAGESAVLNKIIYALAVNRKSVVVAFEFIKSQDKDGDLVYTCKLHKEYEVPGMEDIKFEYVWEDSYWWTQHLVYLGKYNFCLVQSCNLDSVEGFQYIQLTSIELGEKESTVTGISVHKFKVPEDGVFTISHCFSMLPKCKTTTPFKQGGKGFLKFNPCCSKVREANEDLQKEKR